ncbi:MAG: hypothetical protein ACRDY5_05200, partial [Acidimicrobiales bacterium]
VVAPSVERLVACPSGSPIAVELDPALTTDELAAAVAAIAPARTAFGDSGPLVLRFFDRRHVVPEVGGQALPGGVVDLYLPRIREAAPNLGFAEVVVHEYVHTVQFWHAAAGGSADGAGLYATPLWLVEGPAYALMFDFQPGFDRAAYRRSLVRASRGTTAQLRNLVTSASLDGPDAAGRGAVMILGGDYLLATYGGPAVLERYWYERASTDWATAFQRAFGVPASQFYDEFERYRATAPVSVAP